MRRGNINFSMRSSFLALGLPAFATLLFLPGPQVPRAGAADGDPPIVRVEEDWKLVLNEPGSEINAPQFHTVMSPFGGVHSYYAQVSWNYRGLHDFAPGGLQVQAWNGENDLDVIEVGEDALSRDAETITWTQRLETNGSRLFFRIVNGRSTSWGAFGGDSMALAFDAVVPHLDHYSTSVSKSNSWVTFGANRVNLLMITQVRRYDVNGDVHTDDTPVIVYQFQDAGGGGAAGG